MNRGNAVSLCLPVRVGADMISGCRGRAETACCVQAPYHYLVGSLSEYVELRGPHQHLLQITVIQVQVGRPVQDNKYSTADIYSAVSAQAVV